LDYNNKFLKIGNEHGVALVTTLLMIVLMTSLLLMALNVATIEINLAATSRRTTQGFHAAEGGTNTVFPVIQDTLQLNAIPAYPAANVVVDPKNTGGGTFPPDFVRELTTGFGSIADTALQLVPNVKITAIANQPTSVDIDYEGYVTLPGSGVPETGSAYHRTTGGTGCSSGNLYYIDSVANGPLKSQSEVGSSYYSCF
jgi:Tfp pilus assembly protein PilX